MASIHTILDAVIENGTSGKRVQLQVANKREYETIRTRLVTLWSEHRTAIIAIGGEDADPLVNESLCASFDTEIGTAQFYLGKPRRKLAKSYSFEIVGEEPPPELTPANDELANPITRAAE